MRRILTVATLTIALVATAAVAPANACGCGAIVGPEGSSISATQERAIISWDGDRETIELTFDVTSDALNAGLIIPTPTQATVSPGDLRTFEVIESVIQPAISVEKDWWGINYFVPPPEKIVADTTPRVALDPVVPTVLPAADSVGLGAWMATHGYTVSDDLAKAIATYADYGWSFTLLSLTSADVINGHIDPIRVTFDTDRLVYPMRLARAGQGPQNARLFVFDGHRIDVTQAAAPSLNVDADIDEVYASEVTDDRLTGLGDYLSAFDITFDNPKKQVTSDLGFFQSSRSTNFTPTVTEYRPVTLAGLPLGSLLVGWGLIGVLLVVGHFRGRRRAR